MYTLTAIGPWYLETEYNNANMAFINSIKGKSLLSTEDVSDCREDICDEVRDYVNGGNDISKTNIRFPRENRRQGQAAGR